VNGDKKANTVRRDRDDVVNMNDECVWPHDFDVNAVVEKADTDIIVVTDLLLDVILVIPSCCAININIAITIVTVTTVK
jgi:hypothetical protein